MYICSKIRSLLKQNKVQKAPCVYGSVIDNQRGILNWCGKVTFVGNCTAFSSGKNSRYIQLNSKWIKFPDVNIQVIRKKR